MPKADSLPGIDPARHMDLAGRTRSVWARRIALLVIATIPVLGLANVFGQRAETTTSVGRAATLVVDSPSHVRGGLIFTTKIVITPHRRLADGQLYLDHGWFRNMTLNGVAPQPSNEAAHGPWQVWDFGAMPASVPFTVWISWQTNPTNVGRESQTVVLYDGKDELLTAHRTLTVFP